MLTVASVLASESTRHTILLVFAGFAIGWLSATIARSVYPPPKTEGQPRGPRRAGAEGGQFVVAASLVGRGAISQSPSDSMFRPMLLML